MIRLICTLLLLCHLSGLFGQKYEATILRDEWGVPHIHGKTDADAAFGLAWAHCEDDFVTVQHAILGTRLRLPEVIGMEGAILAAGAFMMNADPIVEKYYESDLSPEFRALLTASVSAINQYGREHPEEVLMKDLFPVNEKDIIKGYILAQGMLSNAFFEIARIFTGKIKPVSEEQPFSAGSNGFAFAPQKMQSGESLLISNTHQPLDGMLSWYEAHVVSDEGWNMLGGTFSIGVTLFLGANENLAWTHTTNYPDFADVFQLDMHPKKKHQYQLDGEWLELEERKMKIKVKLGPIKFPFRKKFYWSKFGTTIKKKGHYYAVRFPARHGIKAAEQWWRMNKASNLEEFKDALNMQGLSCQNIIYADKSGNISFWSNGLFPYRKQGIDWHKPQLANTSDLLWAQREYHPITELPQIHNPNSGYLFNCNNPPFLATEESENLKPENFNPTFGFRNKPTNRALRFRELMQSQAEKLSYEEVKKMKYDLNYFSESYYTWNIENFDELFELNPDKHPKIADAIGILQAWDGNTHHSSTQATIAAVSVYFILKYHMDQISIDKPTSIPREVFVDGIKQAKKFLLKHHGSLEVPLGQVQRHIKGDESLPISGMPEVLAPVFLGKPKKGVFRNEMGESYILFASYTEEGLKLETAHPFGASNRDNSPHYTDQMSLFAQQELKPMTLDWDKIKKVDEYVIKSR